MKVKLDENLGRRASEFLAHSGMDVATVVDEGLAGRGDESVIEVARSEGRCFVTLDVDFANPLRFDPRRFSGIAVLRVPAPLRRDGIVMALKVFAEAIVMRSVAGRLWIVEPTRLREYVDDEPEETTGD